MTNLEDILDKLTEVKQDLWMFIDENNLGLNVKVKSAMNDLLDYVEELEDDL